MLSHDSEGYDKMEPDEKSCNISTVPDWFTSTLVRRDVFASNLGDLMSSSSPLITFYQGSRLEEPARLGTSTQHVLICILFKSIL